jgi:hypothetical protein
VNWREHDESRPEAERRVVRDEGTWIERLTGWVLTYPVRTMIVMLVAVMILTFACGL